MIHQLFAQKNSAYPKTFCRRKELDDVKSVTTIALLERIPVIDDLCRQLTIAPPIVSMEKYVTPKEVCPCESGFYVSAWNHSSLLEVSPQNFLVADARLSANKATKALWSDYLWLHGLTEGFFFERRTVDLPLLATGFNVARKAVEDVENQPIGEGWKVDDRLSALYHAVCEVSERSVVPKLFA
jgi:hypothetical protein